MHYDNDTRAPATRRGRLMRPPPQRRPLTQEERAAAEGILRRPLWTGTLERAVAAAVSVAPLGRRWKPRAIVASVGPFRRPPYAGGGSAPPR